MALFNNTCCSPRKPDFDPSESRTIGVLCPSAVDLVCFNNHTERMMTMIKSLLSTCWLQSWSHTHFISFFIILRNSSCSNVVSALSKNTIVQAHLAMEESSLVLRRRSSIPAAGKNKRMLFSHCTLKALIFKSFSCPCVHYDILRVLLFFTGCRRHCISTR